MVQLLLPYIAPGKTIALTTRTFVGKVMSLLFKMLSRFVIAFLPRSRCLLISWLLSPSAVITEPTKVKSVTASISSHSICQEVMGPVAVILILDKSVIHQTLGSCTCLIIQQLNQPKLRLINWERTIQISKGYMSWAHLLMFLSLLRFSCKMEVRH